MRDCACLSFRPSVCPLDGPVEFLKDENHAAVSDGWTNGQMGGWTDGWMDGRTD